jgi:hypothetical protein
MKTIAPCLIAIAALGGSLASSPVAEAQTPAVESFVGGGPFDSFLFVSSTVGWGFQVDEPISVTDLGFWIDTDGVDAEHQVGLWDAEQVLLASVTIEPSKFVEVDGFAYASIEPVTLVPGNVYVVGWTDGVNDGDSYISQAQTANFGDGITWLDSRGSAEGGFSFPAEATNGFGFGRFGPNFLFEAAEVCRGDVDTDGVVGFDDLVQVLAAFGPCGGAPCPADVNDDGVVAFDDVVSLLASWGPC